MKFNQISKTAFSGNSTMRQVINLIVILSMVLGYQSTFVVAAPNVPAPQAAPTNHLSINVVAQRTDPGAGVFAGDPITQYKYLINEDNTGTTEQRSPADGCSPDSPGYPASCHWVSIAGAATHSPIYTQGDQSDFGPGFDLPSGRYLISVLADGFKLGGTSFTMPMEEPGLVTVKLDSTNLPTATIQAAVFEDISPVNGAPDVPLEHGLAGFQGHIADYLGEVTTDVFGNPLCTEYDGNGDPIPGSGGKCLSKCYVVDNGVDISVVDPLDAAGVCPVVTSPATTENPPVADGLTVEGKLKDSKRRSQPVRAFCRGAGWVELDPDHHPGGQPRLGCLGNGRRNRPGHGIRGGWRTIPGDYFWLCAADSRAAVWPARPYPGCG